MTLFGECSHLKHSIWVCLPLLWHTHPSKSVFIASVKLKIQKYKLNEMTKNEYNYVSWCESKIFWGTKAWHACLTTLSMKNLVSIILRYRFKTYFQSTTYSCNFFVQIASFSMPPFLIKDIRQTRKQRGKYYCCYFFRLLIRTKWVHLIFVYSNISLAAIKSTFCCAKQQRSAAGCSLFLMFFLSFRPFIHPFSLHYYKIPILKWAIAYRLV